MIRRAVLAAVVVLLATPALGHDFYDTWCCSGTDCGPITKAEQKDGKWYYTNHTGKPVPVDAETRFMASPDGRTHSCEWFGKLRCLYVPPGN